MKHLIPSLKALSFLSLLTGILYPLLVTVMAQLAFHDKANGQSFSGDGGSLLIGQEFKKPRHFSSRPSAIGYNPMPSGGSNLGPTSAALKKQIAERAATGAKDDMLTSSASGLDPHISPDSARRQIDRVAAARGLGEDQKAKLKKLVENSIQEPDFGFVGSSRVNVLELNLGMDRSGL